MQHNVDWTGPKRQRCPQCGRDGDNGSRGTLGVTVESNGRGVAHCHRCHHVEWRHADDNAGTARAGVAVPSPIQHKTLSQWGRDLFRATTRLDGDGLAYLKARQCAIPPPDSHLRYHPALEHKPSGTKAPALVALVTDASTGEAISLHRTWVQASGRKAPVEPARMLLGSHRKAGGVIRLWPDEAVTNGLAIAEGIETALSLAHAYRPAWACIDAGNLAAFPVLPGIESLVIGADHDEAGIRAATAAADRWAEAGREVHVVLPGSKKSDLNDIAAEAA